MFQFVEHRMKCFLLKRDRKIVKLKKKESKRLLFDSPLFWIMLENSQTLPDDVQSRIHENIFVCFEKH